MRAEYGGREYEFPEWTTLEQMGAALASLGMHNVERGGAAIGMARYADDLSEDDLIGVRYGSGDGEMGINLNPQQRKFVDTIRTIETGGVENPFIRTQAAGTGSSAYGPWQITKSLLQSTLKARPDLFDENERAAMTDLTQRQAVALAVGGSDRRHYGRGGRHQTQGAAWAKKYGFADVDSFLEAFDYGGDLGLGNNVDFQVLYENVAHKLLVQQLEETGGDELEAASRWHGGRGWKSASSRQQTDLYRKRYKKLGGLA